MEKRFYVADAHTDFLYGAVNYGFDFGAPRERQRTNLADFRAGGMALQVFAAWMDSGHQWPFLEQFSRMADAFDKLIATYDTELVRFDKNFGPKDGRIAAVLSVEGGGELLAEAPDMPEKLRARGVRAFSFTWNNSNLFAHGAGRFSVLGLTARGRDAVRRLNEVGIAIDVSHLNDRCTDDVLAVSSAPVFASHSNSRAVCNSPRALKREQIQAIANKGGVICVNFYPKQLRSLGEASIEDVANHIESIASIGGVNCVGLGSDFDGMKTYPKGLDSYSDIPKLLDILASRGFSSDDIGKVAFGNLYGFLRKFG